MSIDRPAIRDRLGKFDFSGVFTQELGWDFPGGNLTIPIDGKEFRLKAIAQKRGVQVFDCCAPVGGGIPPYEIRRKIERRVAKSAFEHLLIFTDAERTTQVWQWVSRQRGQPAQCREHAYHPNHQSGEALIQKLDRINIPLNEEESLDLTGAIHKLRDAFDRDKVTKKFYERFKAEHAAFMKFIKGIKATTDLEWYTSLMLNRLMFVYFIQKKGFLDGHTDYLRNRMPLVQAARGKDKFQSFYRYFLLRLFHDGLGKAPEERKLDRALEKLLGKVPYLNGGFFEVHQLEERNAEIDIPDKAFERLFDFFDEFRWHLDERPLAADNEINPDVVGYIFEKYINQKQMGAYYTKEDITEYISKNTIIPFLFDAAEKKCPIAFKPGSFLWRLLSDDPDRYIYAAMRKGVIDDAGAVIPLPTEIEAGVQHVAQRNGWNKPAPQPFALPTETWREHVARRSRCLELREKLKSGEVHAINDCVTLNLDIWQFARDAIVHSEGPELLRAFWQAIERVTVLDPTCGSGAFLFAALRILETLYSDCLERMQRFVEDLPAAAAVPSSKGRGAGSVRPSSLQKFSDFRAVLAQIDKHTSDRYFILKSIIINNLFGVDIMDEAVEICKLRLFLKLVAQVDSADRIEPLPDIDFNIRAGNTLVGYVSLDQVRDSQKGTLGFGAKEIERIEEDALAVEKAFEQFRAQQTTHGGRVTSKDKQELRKRLAKLDAELDQYLAGEYGVDPKGKKPQAFDTWKASHQPFHWFVEFYGIMANGGFDIVIGNPPYIELKEVRNYVIRGYRCESAGNLYAPVIERCFAISPRQGRLGFIVPVSSISTDRYESLQSLLTTRSLHFSSFDDRPSRLFDGLEHIRLTIHILGQLTSTAVLNSTRYNKWSADERSILFQTLRYETAKRSLVVGALPKLSFSVELAIIEKLRSQDHTLSGYYTRSGGHSIFYSRKVGYFLQVLDFPPKVLDGKGNLRPPSEFKELSFPTEHYAKLALCCLNSNLCYWFVTVFSDCRHVNKREVDSFPIDLEGVANGPFRPVLMKLAAKLMRDLDKNSEERLMKFKHDSLTVQCIIPKRSKALIDEIDQALGKHFGFSDDEIDFITNYDIKYRIGVARGDDDD